MRFSEWFVSCRWLVLRRTRPQLIIWGCWRLDWPNWGESSSLLKEAVEEALERVGTAPSSHTDATISHLWSFMLLLLWGGPEWLKWSVTALFFHRPVFPAGFDVAKTGDARIGFVGFPSVGKSTLLSNLAGVYSEVAAYEFTTLTTVPGVIRYKGAKIQVKLFALVHHIPCKVMYWMQRFLSKWVVEGVSSWLNILTCGLATLYHFYEMRQWDLTIFNVIILMFY